MWQIFLKIQIHGAGITQALKKRKRGRNLIQVRQDKIIS